MTEVSNTNDINLSNESIVDGESLIGGQSITGGESITGSESITGGEIKEEPEEMEKELARILQQKKELEEKEHLELLEREENDRLYLKIVDDAKYRLGNFLDWMKNLNIRDDNVSGLYGKFEEELDPSYRTKLFENICEFFKDESFVSDEILFYWKLIVISLLKNSKKYKTCIQDLRLDLVNHLTNLRMVKEKFLFKCFINNELLCYFKENGNNYYVS